MKLALTVVLLLGLAGCEYAAKPDDLAGEYRRPDTQESLTLKTDGTAIVRNMPSKPAEFRVRWKRLPANDDATCTWIDFEPLTPEGVEWHTCANRIVFRRTVFIGYPGVDPDESGSFYEKIN